MESPRACFFTPCLPLLKAPQQSSSPGEGTPRAEKTVEAQHEIWLQEEKEKSQVLAPCCSLLHICFDARVNIADTAACPISSSI